MKPGAAVDTHAHVARTRPAWTTRPGWRAPRSSLVLGGLVLAAVLSTRWLRLNVSPSVPYGLYRLAPLTRPLARGTLVVLPVPRSVRPWHARWVPLLKPVAAVAGDLVCLWDHGLCVAGQWYGPLWREAAGRPLPQIRGCFRVPEGAVFLASPLPTSLDGRYFGVTPLATLTAQAMPVLTWR